MPDINLKTATPDTSLPTDGFLFGADSQASASPSVYSTQTVATTLLGSTSLTGATITTSQPVLDLAQTWNAGAVTFTAIKMNVTDTTSNAGSNLLDLQVGGASKFKLAKDGSATFGSTLVAAVGLSSGPSYSFTGETNTGMYRPSARLLGFSVNSSLIMGMTDNGGNAFRINGNIEFSTNVGNAGDLFLSRRAAANLRLGAADAAAPVAQTLSVQSVVAGTSNTTGTNFTITGSQGTGTGAGGSIIFQVAPAGSTGTAQNALATAWSISGAGNFLAGTDNTYDIGASSATRPRNVYAGTSITPGAGVVVASLPTPSTGMIARVTNASAPIIGSTVVGGGAAQALVWYNGANWTVIGV